MSDSMSGADARAVAGTSTTAATDSTPVQRPWLRRRGIWLAGLVALGGIGLLALRQSKGDAVGAIDQALVAKVKRVDLEVVVLETGRVEPLLQTQVKSRVGGQVIGVEVVEGQKVTKGQVLLRIDPSDYQRDVDRTEAEIAQFRQTLAYAGIQLGRTEKASKVAVAPAAELDQARHEVALSRAKLKGAEVALATARDRLGYTQISAPFDGTIIQRNIQPGEVVVPGVTATVEGKPLLVLADMSRLLVKTDLNQIDVAHVQKAQKVEVTLDALPGKKFSAEVTRVAPASVLVNARDVFPVETTLDPAQDLSAIKPGMTADVRILVERKPKVLVLPIEAVVTEKGKSFVHRLEAPARGEVVTQKRDIVVGTRNDRELEVVGGLAEGDQVLIKPPPAGEAKF